LVWLARSLALVSNRYPVCSGAAPRSGPEQGGAPGRTQAQEVTFLARKGA